MTAPPPPTTACYDAIRALLACPGARADLGPVRVGRLHGPALPSAETPTRDVLVGPHTLVYYAAPGPGTPTSEDLAMHFRDGLASELRARLGAAAVDFLSPAAALGMLALVDAHAASGEAFLLDPLSGEVTREPVHLHPARADGRRDGTAPPASDGPPPPPSFDSCLAGASLRQREPDVDGLVSAHLGLIRSETVTQTLLSNLVAHATLRTERGDADRLCGGEALTHEAAERTARCEAVERYQVGFRRPGAPLVLGTYREVADRALDPADLFFDRSAPSEVLSRYHADLPMYWTWAWAPQSGTARLVPAAEVWFDIWPLPGGTTCTQSTTSGAAVGGSLTEAAVFALAEVAERDAVLAAWHLQRPLPRIDPASITDEAFQLARLRIQQAHPDVEVVFLDASADTAIPVVWAVGVRRGEGEGHRTIHAAAAHLDPGRAAMAALRDVASRFGATARFEADRPRLREAWADPTRVEPTPDDHLGLYGLDEAFSALAFLDLTQEPTVDAEALRTRGLDTLRLPDTVGRGPVDLRDVLDAFVERFGAVGLEPLLVDLTHDAFRERGLSCVRAVVGGALPMAYGLANQRGHWTDRLRRLAPPGAEWNGRLHPFS